MKRLICFLIMLHTTSALAYIKPNATAVFVSETDAEGSLVVSNVSERPLLLHTKIETVDKDKKDDSKMVIPSQPVIRLNPGQSHNLRLLLNNVSPSKVERLLLLKLNAIPEQRVAAKQGVQFHISQVLPLIIEPKNKAIDPKPWEQLVLEKTPESLSIHNTGYSLVRLDAHFSDNMGKKYDLGKRYILPNERLSIVVQEKTNAITSLTIHPVSRQGAPLPAVTLPLK